jgi:7-cyano-7-deazaguanine reductase
MAETYNLALGTAGHQEQWFCQRIFCIIELSILDWKGNLNSAGEKLPMAKITGKSDLEELTLLRRGSKPAKRLETFPNHHPNRDYVVTLHTEEFTCVCPATGQPDFAKLSIQYIPDQKILESKSLKLYLWSFRNQGAFHEHVTNAILDDLVKALKPRWCKVTADFSVRGGISINVEAEYKK